MHEETIVLGGGCFWCIEAILTDLKGVSEVVSGYAGGVMPNPTYERVCSGVTGHAEVVQVTFEPSVISLHDLLTIFFTLHDPTTLNQQGNDIGSQYRSVIFYRDAQQKEFSQQVMTEIDESGIWEDQLVTALEPLPQFYPAEEYHQHYFAQHPDQGYCRVIIAPKVTKLRHQFQNRLNA